MDHIRNSDKKIEAQIRKSFPVEDIYDPPLTIGQRIVIVEGDGSKRMDLVGQEGVLMDIVTGVKGSKVLIFTLDSGLEVSNTVVWWRRKGLQ